MASDPTFVTKATLDETVYVSGRDMRSESGPALASYNGRVWVAWTGADRRLNVMSSTDGVLFDNKLTLNERSSTQPSIAVHERSLMLAWTGGGGKLNVARLTDQG